MVKKEWTTPEEAAKRTAELRETHGVTTGRTISAQGGPDILALLDELEAAEGPPPDGDALVITIPAPIQPIERGERFEDPLAEALGDLGEIDGGGSECREVDGKLEIAFVDIVIYVRDVQECLPIIRRVLKAQGVPEGTTIRQRGPIEIVHSLDESA